MDIMDIEYYAYELIDPRNGEVFYVGKGNGDRMYRHRNQAFQKKASKYNPHKSSRIRQIITEGFDIQYKKYKCLNEDEAFKKEQELIKRYGKRVDNTGTLTNLTDGGEGYTGGHIPVCQYDVFGNFIQQHRSAKDAALLLGKEQCSQITAVCRGGHRGEITAFGYLWSYVGELPITHTKRKPVFQWTLTGVLVNQYSNASVAARHIGCDPSNIPVAIKHNYVSSGYIWSYENKFPGVTKSKKLKKVKHVNTNKVYDSVTAASKETAHTIQSICAVCNGKKSKVGDDVFVYA